MDTKWTKFKENSFTKAMCIVLACIMLVLACNSGLKVARYLYCFGNISGQNTFVDSHSFEYLYRQDIEAITQSVLYNKREKDIESERERGAEEFLAEYKEYKAKYDSGLPDESKFIEGQDYYREDGTFETTMYSSYYEYSNIFETDITVNIINYVYSIYVNARCDEALTDDKIKEKFINEFNNVINENPYTSPEELAARNIKNILYYAKADDGTVVTNTSGKEEVLSKANDNNIYLLFENDEITSNANNIIRDNFNSSKNSGTSGTTVYIVIDPSFSQNDHYKEYFDNITATSQMNVEKFIAETVIYGVLALIFFIITMCLAGHKNGQEQLAPIDKLPYDIHLAVSGGLVTLCIIGFFVYISNYFDYLYLYDPGMHFKTPIGLLKKPYYPLIPNALTVLAYLFTAEFFTSLARGIKAKTNIFKNTFIYMVCAFIVKMVVKFFKALKKFIKGIVYKPKHFDRKTTAAIVLYTLFNIISVLFVILSYNVGIGTIAFLGTIYALGVLALDGYIIYLVMKYLKSLDNIITAVENGEPTSDNAENLPNSLKILANSYDIANANLQSAIVKAVKDERTKAELITNVSHDLKTPLTSVINYIDLLQKCNIEDETAREYMGVIAEKSGKLKRLIEDLIEASKISSGNVTINKTKLNLNELAAQAIVEESAEFEKRDLQLIFEEPANKHIAFADGTKIYRVLENLLSNAKKYSAPGSRIYSRLYSGTDCEYFEIKNISKEQLNISAQELTERFVRGDKSRNEDGNGLGLSIATELCRLNGGELILSIDGDLFKATVKIPKE